MWSGGYGKRQWTTPTPHNDSGDLCRHNTLYYISADPKCMPPTDPMVPQILSTVTPDEKKRESIVLAANSPCYGTRGGIAKSGVGPPPPPPLPRPPPLPLNGGLHSLQRTIIGSRNLDIASFNILQNEFTHVGILNTNLKQRVRTGDKE